MVNSTTFSSNTTHPTASNGILNHLMSTKKPNSNPDRGAANSTNVQPAIGSSAGRNKNQGATQIVSSINSTEKPVGSRTGSGESGSNYTTESLVSSDKNDDEGNRSVRIITTRKRYCEH